MVTARVAALRGASPRVRAFHVRTILIVEHDPSQAESFTRHITFKAHQYVHVATSAAAALHFVTHIKPTLFLLTYHLPDLDGLTLYDLLHETRGLASIPAIIVGVPLPQPALAVIKTEQLVLMGPPIDREELGRDLARLGLSFVMH